MRHFYLISTAMSVALFCSAAHAQTASLPDKSEDADKGSIGVEDIVVTAQRRAQNLQDVPISVVAVSGNDLAHASVKSIQDLATLVSGFVGPGEGGLSSTHLRGVGSQVSQPGIENSVATYVDGIYIGALGQATGQLSHVRDVEVLKGPQGTLFGRNTTGGLVQISTLDPDDTFRLSGELGYANHQTVSGALYIGGPLGASVKTNLSVQASTAGKGWGTNLLTGNQVYKADLDLAVRNRWTIDLSEDTKMELSGDYQRRKDQGFFDERPVLGTTNQFGMTSTVTGWNTLSNTDEKGKTETWGGSGRLSHDFGFAKLTNTAAYRRSNFDQLDQDVDISPVPALTFNRRTENKQFTDELQLSSPTNRAVTWTAGLFYYNSVDSTDFNIYLPPDPLAPKQQLVSDAIRTHSYAAYAQAEYKISPSTTLTGGLRFTHDTHGIVGDTNYVLQSGVTVPGVLFFTPPVDSAFSKNSVAWRAALSQQLSGQLMVYASYNRGSKSGGYNPANPNGPLFLDERLDAFEVGAKSTFLDKRIRLNASGFLYYFNNIQETQFLVASSFVYNGAAARMYGFDVDIELRPVAGLKINASAEVLHSEFTDFPNASIYTPLPAGGYAQTLGSVKGFQLPLSPSFTSSLAAVYSLPVAGGTLDLSGNWSHNSGYFGDPGHAVRQPAFDLLGASVQFTTHDGKYFVRVWGTNLANEEVAQIQTISPIGTGVALGAPRRYGMTVGLNIQ